MQRISFAPVLSATLSRDSCWIIDFSWLSCRFSTPHGRRAWPNLWLLGLLDDLDDAPALGGRQRAGLHDQDPVADAALVLLVVRLQLAGAAHDLAVERVLDAVLDGHDHGLVHLVGDDQALTGLAGVPLRGLLAHASPSSLLSWPGAGRRPASRSRTTV